MSDIVTNDDFIKGQKAIKASLSAYAYGIQARRMRYDKAGRRRKLHQNIKTKRHIDENFFELKMLVIVTINEGIPYKLFEEIKQFTPFKDDNWADYLNISLKTLQRYKKEPGFYFKPIHTEKILELAEVTNYGAEVFGSLELFYEWLQTPALVFEGEKPSDLLKNSYGKELVMDELNRIEYGIFV